MFNTLSRGKMQPDWTLRWGLDSYLDPNESSDDGRGCLEAAGQLVAAVGETLPIFDAAEIGCARSRIPWR
jgi:hypothetical protein